MINAQVASWAWRRRVSPAGVKLTLLALASFANENGFYQGARGRLAGLTSQGERTVRRHLEALERAGLIQRQRRVALTGRYRPDCYRLIPRHEPAARAGVATGDSI